MMNRRTVSSLVVLVIVAYVLAFGLRWVFVKEDVHHPQPIPAKVTQCAFLDPSKQSIQQSDVQHKGETRVVWETEKGYKKVVWLTEPVACNTLLGQTKKVFLTTCACGETYIRGFAPEPADISKNL